MKRVLVSGVCGFTAKHLVPRLVGDGYEVHGFSRAEDSTPPPTDVNYLHSVNLDETDSLGKKLAEIRPDKMVHLAGIAFVAHGDAGEIYRSNLIASRNLLQATIDSGIPPPAIILVSSASVYGNRRHGMIEETASPDPVNDYAVSKLAMEFVARIYQDRLPITIVRPFNYTGVGQSIEFVIPKIVDHARRRAPSIELGNIDVRRDFSDVRSVIDAYVRLLECPDKVDGVYNVCSGQSHSLRQVLELVEKISGHRMDVQFNPRFVRINEVPVLYGSNAKLQNAVGPLCLPDFEDTLRWMIEAD